MVVKNDVVEAANRASHVITDAIIRLHARLYHTTLLAVGTTLLAVGLVKAMVYGPQALPLLAQ